MDLDSGKPLDPPRKLRTRTQLRAAEPLWVETAVWSHVACAPGKLGVRVRLIDACCGGGGAGAGPCPLGEATLPLGSGDASDDSFARELWLALEPSPKMRRPPAGAVKVLLSFNFFARFSCQVCGRSSGREAKGVCRVCGATPTRTPNPKISDDDLLGLRLQDAWLSRRRKNFQMPRQPLASSLSS